MIVCLPELLDKSQHIFWLFSKTHSVRLHTLYKWVTDTFLQPWCTDIAFSSGFQDQQDTVGWRCDWPCAEMLSHAHPDFPSRPAHKPAVAGIGPSKARERWHWCKCWHTSLPLRSASYTEEMPPRMSDCSCGWPFNKYRLTSREECLHATYMHAQHTDAHTWHNLNLRKRNHLTKQSALQDLTVGMWGKYPRTLPQKFSP